MKIDSSDIVVLCGTGFVAYGCWTVYPPLAFIVVGILMCAVGAVGIFRKVGG